MSVLFKSLKGSVAILAVVVLALTGLASSANADVVHTLESEITGVGAPAWGYSTGVAVDDSALGISSGDVYVAESIGFPPVGAVDKFKRELGVWQYGCQITGAGSASTSASECNTSIAGPGTFTGKGFSPPIYQPAVSASGDLYVPDYASNAVDEFSPDGEYLGQITGAAEPRSVAIASSGEIYIASNAEGILYRYDPTSKTLVEFVKALGVGSLPSVAVDNDAASPSYGDVYIVNSDGAAVEEYSATGAKKATIAPPSGSFGSPGGVAVDQSDGHLYVADAGAEVVDEFNAEGDFLGQITGAETQAGSLAARSVAAGPGGEVYVDTGAIIDVFGPGQVTATPATGAASEVGVSGATLEGTVNPEGTTVASCSFEYGTSAPVYEHSVPCKQTSGEIGNGHGPVPVSAEVTGLESGIEYDYRLATKGATGPSVDGGNAIFTTLIPPKATPTTGAASKVGLNSATLKGTVNPEGITVTSCSFEYGTNFLGSEHSVPCKQTSGEIGEGTSPVPVSAEVAGLEASTTYNFVLVVASAPGTASGGIAAFTTLTPRHATSTTGTASSVGLTSATLEGAVNPEETTISSCSIEYGTGFGYEHSLPCKQTSGEIGEGTSPVPVSAEVSNLEPDTTYDFRLVVVSVGITADGSNTQFTTLGPPVIESVSSSAITGTTAQLHATINPKATQTTYHFEYDTREYTPGEGSHGTSVPVPDATVGEGTAGVAESVELTGLAPETTYYYRVVATNAREEVSYSGDYQLSTRPATPLIQQTLASPVGSTSATLTAYVTPDYPQSPDHSQTTYHFEYGTSESYGSEAPSFDRDIGSGSEPVLVQEPISGLSPGVTYYFRVVAHNSTGTRYGPAQKFTTLPASGASGSCPNEQVRKESDVNPEMGQPFSLQLPECRAYEMVSPALKNGAPISSVVATALSAGSSVARVGLEGSTVLIRSTGIWPGGEQPADNNLLDTLAGEAVQYRITRGESGWSFRPAVPADLRQFKNELLPSPADVSTNGVWSGAGIASTEDQIDLNFSPNIYFLGADDALGEVGPSVPLADQHQRVFGGGAGSPGEVGDGLFAAVGGSADLSRVLFKAPGYRWSFDQTTPSIYTEIPSLYEYIGTGHTGEGGDVPTLVGVDNTGALISECGTEAVGHEGFEGGRSEGSSEPEARSISAGGSTVFFMAMAEGSECNGGTGPSVNEVFARVGDPGTGAAVGDAVTVNVAGSEATACAASDSCNVTGPVTYQGASTDGSKVFFTSEQPLVAGDTDSTSNLYECGLPGDAGTPPPRSDKVNPCPNLARVSVPVVGSSAGAEVQSVAAVSQDGSHVYFVAKGVLSGSNAEHNSPTQGQDNLYVWEAGGHTAFIATLSSAAFNLGEVQVTPDGEQLVFTSSADLTPDDTSTVSQVFLYEAEHEALIRISKGQDGFNEDGNTTTDPASIVSTTYGAGEYQAAEGRRVISEDGSTIVFQSSDALTPQIHGGTRNVYLWRGGNVYLISDGTPMGNKKVTDGGNEAGLVGIDASGQNVFFTTEAQLVGQDKDELSNLYDARVEGGFPAPKIDECVGEACQGTPPHPAATPSPGSLSSGGAGNLTPLPAVKSTTRPKSLTRAQKLAKALRACTKDKAKKKRVECQAAARKLYGTKHKTKKRKTSKSAGKRGKR